MENEFFVPVVSVQVDDDIKYPPPYQWVVTSPSGVVTEKGGPGLAFSPLDEGFWNIALNVKDEDDKWIECLSHSFEHPPAENDTENNGALCNISNGVN